jgi:hypothetical protein
MMFSQLTILRSWRNKRKSESAPCKQPGLPEESLLFADAVGRVVGKAAGAAVGARQGRPVAAGAGWAANARDLQAQEEAEMTVQVKAVTSKDIGAKRTPQLHLPLAKTCLSLTLRLR